MKTESCVIEETSDNHNNRPLPRKVQLPETDGVSPPGIRLVADGSTGSPVTTLASRLFTLSLRSIRCCGKTTFGESQFLSR